jgi:hypothetical protein
LQGGRETENDGGENRDGKREEKNGNIEADDGFGGNDPWGHQGNETLKSAPGREGAENGAAHSEEETFHEKLADDAPAAGAEGGAYGEFFFAGGGAGKEQVGNVATPDEEKESDGSEDDVESGAELADDEVGQRFNVNAEFLGVVLGINGGEIFGNYGEV